MTCTCNCPSFFCCMLQCALWILQCRSPPLFWENWRTPGRYEFLAQVLSTAAPRYRRRNIVEKWAKPRIILLDFGPQPSICLRIHSSLLPSVPFSRSVHGRWGFGRLSVSMWCCERAALCPQHAMDVRHCSLYKWKASSSLGKANHRAGTMCMLLLVDAKCSLNVFL